LQMNGVFGGGTLNTHDGGLERRSRESDRWVVGEAEAFFGNSDKVAVKPGVTVFVVNGG